MTTSAPTTRDAGRRRTDGWALAAFLVAVAVAALLGGLATSGAGSTYASLDLPPYAPPSWLFGPVWSVLYVMIAVAGWLYWRRVRDVDAGLVAYAVQLVLNAVWTPLFFGADKSALALVDIVLLAIGVAVTIGLFAPRSRPAAWLLLPYLTWVLYAGALNAGILALN
ncbi:TspO/MBR family protein [Nocardioides sp. MH1]|uniref:TspO/MBR family protein n=1 Tax=Nocardioides sp. MH1 TaxID=3242490 RepID=UPI003521535C